MEQKTNSKLNHQRIFYISEKQIQQKFNTIDISGEDFHHLVNVLRLKANDKIICKTYGDNIYFCSLKATYTNKATFFIEETQTIKKPPLFQRKVGIFLCIPRPPILSSIVSKLTELGINFLQLIFSERSFFKTSEKINLIRYEKIVQETMKQCGGNTALRLNSPISLKDISFDRGTTFFNNIQNHQKSEIEKILLWECEENNILSPNPYSATEEQNPVVLFIGPEGGINHWEKNYLEKIGFETKSISNNILKVETALMLALGKIL